MNASTAKFPGLESFLLSLWSHSATTTHIPSCIISISSKRVRVSHFPSFSSQIPLSPSKFILGLFPFGAYFTDFYSLHSWKFLDIHFSLNKCMIEAENCIDWRRRRKLEECVFGWVFYQSRSSGEWSEGFIFEVSQG